jgi:hypothetical protein
MTTRNWGIVPTAIVCVDDYHNGTPQGVFYYPHRSDEISFESMAQFLLQTERSINRMEGMAPLPRSRSFGTPGAWRMGHNNEQAKNRIPDLHNRKGALATFGLRILFRQNYSWQGTITWMEGGQQRSFRSVLELINLVDSALQEILEKRATGVS